MGIVGRRSHLLSPRIRRSLPRLGRHRRSSHQGVLVLLARSGPGWLARSGGGILHWLCVSGSHQFHLHAGLHWRPREFRSTPRRSTGRPAGGLDAITRWRGNGGDSLSRPGSESACGRVTHQGTRPQPISYEKGATDELSKWGEQFWNIV